jgi:hypothetical protein
MTTIAHTFVVILLSIAVAACGRVAAGPAALKGDSKTLLVQGQFMPVTLDRVDRLSLSEGKLVLHGGTNVTVDLPATADSTRLVRHWALITETNADTKRSLTFTHEEKLDDFTIELPPSDAPVRHGGFAGKDGADVLVFAWGAGSQSFWGYVTIARKGGGTRGQ